MSSVSEFFICQISSPVSFCYPSSLSKLGDHQNFIEVNSHQTYLVYTLSLPPQGVEKILKTIESQFLAGIIMKNL
ncbi:hypothetical protein HMI56_006999 [Coelomomyces lativittatus]|nr:hypothetical protein HMI56_006999 [Coelomomyces lativittatus]